ncbi:GNAT family N-acetyltransferase [Ktedonobacter racemifer]|uniref:GCN5-related N-acetyltransferase n=1 Tax=Ktedonobacter racemifer DSM 44963 TaxID=485913 RepID=D6TJG3_KTERA|nr:GNAT family N-acetyltransferase [Ktedonobacter racemifer]EFH89570.1 conserved hypothetical protein [Ktedonobacter racemifer DSM 44963]
MHSQTAASSSYRKELGDGLVLRWSTPADTERLTQLAAHVFRDKAEEPPNEDMGAYARALMQGDHPLMSSYDFGLVEDTHKEGNPVVACACLWRHEWEYEGLRFPVGRPEIVASDPQYRNRGLIRELFALLHARSESEGHPVQAITGIPYFYRQFGYEYALDLGGSCTINLALLPQLKAGGQETCQLRSATRADIDFIQHCYTRRQADSIVWNSLPDAFWQYHIDAWHQVPLNVHNDLQLILDPAGERLGYVFAMARRGGPRFTVWAMDIAPGVNAQQVMPSLLHALKALGEQAIVTQTNVGPLQKLSLSLGGSHPLYTVISKQLVPVINKPYAWYVRVHDLPAFLYRLAPVLERRLAASALAGYSGDLKLNFYRDGVQLTFKAGKLEQVTPWRVPTYEANASASFAPLVFLQLLFGYRKLEDLRYAFPDTNVADEAEALLGVLFPTRPSFVFG